VTRKTITVYIDEEAYDLLRRLIAPKGISREIEDLIKKRIEEIEGGEYNPLESVDYEALKREYERLVEKAEKMTRKLKKRKTYHALMALADELIRSGADTLETLIPQILEKWQGKAEDAHLFISLLETLDKKEEAEEKLEKIRLSAIRG
jgi:hypothetical protein